MSDHQYHHQQQQPHPPSVALDLALFSAPDFQVAQLVSDLTGNLIAQSKQDGGGERARCL